MNPALAAVDLGATSGRVIIGHVDAESLVVTEVHRFVNSSVQLPDGWHWNPLELLRQILVGLRKAEQDGADIVSLGIDSWGVDYGLVAEDGRLVGLPYHYRDERNRAAVGVVHAQLEPADLYARTGVQFLAFNTVYQLAADQVAGTLDAAATMLLMPDLLGFWLTGKRWSELTNASTTSLLDVHSHSWADDLLNRLGYARTLFADLYRPGRIIGPLRLDMTRGAGLSAAIELTVVGSHDTASAVAGVPAEHGPFAYISSGTWGCVGLELDQPLVTDEARQSGFTNEVGVDGKTRFLHNVVGLWLVEESLRHWQAAGMAVELETLLMAAAALPSGGPTIDPNDARLVAPGDIPTRIQSACAEVGQTISDRPPEILRCIIDSLALAFAQTIREAERLSGERVAVVHLVGGGARNELLCQLTADACGMPVMAGPVEAAALGNLLVQARAHRLLAGSLADSRALIRRTQPMTIYEPLGQPISAR